MNNKKLDERVWLAFEYINKISHRKLTRWECQTGRTPGPVFGSWEEAHAYTLAQRERHLRETKARYEAAKRQLAVAKQMKKPEGA